MKSPFTYHVSDAGFWGVAVLATLKEPGLQHTHLWPLVPIPPKTWTTMTFCPSV